MSSSPSISIIYSYYEKNERYRMNLMYFLKKGYIKAPSIDYCFVINGQHTVNFPKEYNIKVIQRDNVGYDFQGYYIGLISLKKNYDYYIFVNSSVRGPYTPPYTSLYFKWYQPFIDLLKNNPKTKLVGPTINIQPPMDALKVSQYLPHVQSYCFVTDHECVQYLLSTHLWDKAYTTKYEVITHQEINMSTLVLQRGWSINCLIPEYQSIDYHSRDFSESIHGDILWAKNELGRVIHPYETIFLKTDRGIGNKEIDTFTEYTINVNDMCFLVDNMINIAICFHFGYSNMWTQFADYIHNVYKCGYNIDLYVTYQKKTDPINLIRKQYPNTIFIQTTRGCDTGAFLLQLERIYNSPKQYDYIFKLHTKKKEDWRKALLDNIAGSSDQVRLVCETFSKNKQIGMISGTTQWIHRPDNINDPLISNLCQQLGLKMGDNCSFVAGTIFWVRWSVLQQFIKQSGLIFKQEYDKCELGYLLNNKPTYMHSWERIYGYIIGYMGFQTVAVNKVDLLSSNSIGYDPGSHIITKVNYGLSEKESIDLSEILRKDITTDLWSINTCKQWGDPYPLKEKKLFIYFNNGSSLVLNESLTRLVPNNFVIKYEPVGEGKELIFRTQGYNNLENYVMIKSNGQLGQYCLTFFDWAYYYEKYQPWLTTKTYHECLQHYIKCGYESNLLTFEPGRSLIDKYKIKLIAYYVPAYSEENIKQWKPLYREHQIKVPPDNYNLNDVNTLKRQAVLAHRCGITGFCFQHYWESGRKILAEPAELLLMNDMINIDFCFSWNTESISSNRDGWIGHFNYLLPFFRDRRYIRVNQQPVFLINSMAKTDSFVEQWNQMAANSGLGSIFFVDLINNKIEANRPAQRVTENNPLYLHNTYPSYCQDNRRFITLDYSRLFHALINQNQIHRVYFRELFVGYDNSANPKVRRKMICINRTINSIYCALKAQFENIMEKPNPNNIDNLVFIHSWNDWENQMIIEPDKTVNREVMTAITNLVHQYTYPNVHNKRVDMIF